MSAAADRKGSKIVKDSKPRMGSKLNLIDLCAYGTSKRIQQIDKIRVEDLKGNEYVWIEPDILDSENYLKKYIYIVNKNTNPINTHASLFYFYFIPIE